MQPTGPYGEHEVVNYVEYIHVYALNVHTHIALIVWSYCDYSIGSLLL